MKHYQSNSAVSNIEMLLALSLYSDTLKCGKHHMIIRIQERARGLHVRENRENKGWMSVKGRKERKTERGGSRESGRGA